MLLRVQVYPASLTPTETVSDEVPTAAVTHFASLASTPNEPSFPLQPIWSLGRKQGSYQATSDKSVSREHAVVSVVCLNPPYTESKNTIKRNIKFLTPEQTDACQAATDQMCVLLRNVGKLGSYLVVGDATSNESKGADHIDADDDSDTADDEEVVRTQQSQAAAAAVLDVTVSDAAKHLYQQGHIGTPRLQSIGVEESIVLETLSCVSSEGTRRRRELAVVQCGKLGTTVALQRVHIRLVVSSDAKKAVSELEPYLSTVGCTLEENLLSEMDDDYKNATNIANETVESVESVLSQRNEITFLVAEKYSPTSKHLTAWSRGIPVVTSKFVKSLCFDRKSPSDRFPIIADYTPKSDGHDFWTTSANPKLWASCIFLSTKHDENEMLVRSAGAMVVPLYKIETATGKILMMDNVTVESLIERETSAAPCFALDNRLAVTKLIKQNGVPLLTVKHLAQGITQQELLKDSQGSPIGNADHATAVHLSARDQTEAIVGRTRKSRNDTTHGNGSVDDKPVNKELCPSNESDGIADGIELVDTDYVVVSHTSKAKSKEDPASATESVEPSKEEHISLPATRNRSTMRAPPKRKPTAIESNVSHLRLSDDDDNGDDTTDRKRQKTSAISTTPTSADWPTAPCLTQSSKLNHDDHSAHPKKKKYDGGTPIQGWMSALPQGTKRLEYRRSNDEIREITGQDKFYDAETVKYTFAKASEATTAVSAVVIPATVLDFRTFRKNTVPMQPLCAVAVHNAVSKESDHRRKLEKLREENETQQRRVDALFGG